jgi:hypothetical protein
MFLTQTSVISDQHFQVVVRSRVEAFAASGRRMGSSGRPILQCAAAWGKGRQSKRIQPGGVAIEGQNHAADGGAELARWL